MPLFDFLCEKCGQEFQHQLPFGSKELPACPECKGSVRKLIRPPMVHFKGSGFYKTDSSSKPVSVEKKETPKEPKESKDSKGSDGKSKSTTS